MMLDSPEQIDETVLGLCTLSDRVLALLQTPIEAPHTRFQAKTLALLYTEIRDAIELLASYEEAHEKGDNELAHEFGMSYSSILEDIEEKIISLRESGIVIVLQ